MRTIFGNIISELNLEPKINVEYIYNLDTLWSLDRSETISVKKYLIVENVEQLDAGNYCFNLKGGVEQYTCSYGWAFIENTTKNIELLKHIDKEINLLNNQELKIKELKNKLNSLYKKY